MLGEGASGGGSMVAVLMHAGTLCKDVMTCTGGRVVVAVDLKYVTSRLPLKRLGVWPCCPEETL